MSELGDWLVDLAARLATVTGWAGFAYPPPSITPPAVLLLPGAGFVTGPRRTGCLVDVAVTARLVSAVHETSGAYQTLVDTTHAALTVLPMFESVDLRAVTYGESRWWCADILVSDTASIDYAPRAVLVAAPS